MPGAYWYGGLVLISFLMVAAAFYYKKDYRLFVLHMDVAAIIHPFELMVLQFNAYRFIPGILPGRMDDYLGAYASDLFIVPASAVVINAFSLTWRTRIIFAAVFSSIDWYFTKLGIYEHGWWKSYYTGILLIVFYYISSRLWTGLRAELPSRLFRILVIYLSYFTMEGVMNFAANRGDKLYILQISSWHLADELQMSAILVSIYLFLVAAAVALFTGLKMPLGYRAIGIGMIPALNWAISYCGIFIPHANITAQYLNITPCIAIPLLIVLFRAARLDYLFP